MSIGRKVSKYGSTILDRVDSLRHPRRFSSAIHYWQKYSQSGFLAFHCRGFTKPTFFITLVFKDTSQNKTRNRNDHLSYPSRRECPEIKPSTPASASNKTHLLPNFPNPFNPETWIPYKFSEAGEVEIVISDMRVIAIRRLALGHQSAAIISIGVVLPIGMAEI